MTLDSFIAQLKSLGQIDFEDTIQVITENFNYTPTSFTNGLGDGLVQNLAGQNEGSCKIFAFADMMQLSQDETLRCFGRFYQDVLNTPEQTDHSNIRNFMKTGWEGIKFEGQALRTK